MNQEELEKAIERAFKNSQLIQRLENIERKIEQRKSQQNYKNFISQRKKPFRNTMNPDFNNGSG